MSWATGRPGTRCYEFGRIGWLTLSASVLSLWECAQRSFVMSVRLIVVVIIVFVVSSEFVAMDIVCCPFSYVLCLRFPSC